MSVRPRRDWFTFRVVNKSEFPVRVDAGGVFVRALSKNRRLRSHPAVVTVRKTAKPQQKVVASARCPSRMTAVVPSIDVPVPHVEGTGSVRGRRGFRFSAFNFSGKPKRVRFHGSCFSQEVR